MSLRRRATTTIMAVCVPLSGCARTTLDVAESHPASPRYTAAPVPTLSAFTAAKGTPVQAPAEDHSHHHHHHHHGSGASGGAPPVHEHGAKP